MRRDFKVNEFVGRLCQTPDHFGVSWKRPEIVGSMSLAVPPQAQASSAESAADSCFAPFGPEVDK
jgi:hypothetical protein